MTAGGRIGEGKITVSGPSVSLDPTESLIGSTITVSGTGFASEERVEVLYDGAIEEVGKTDSSGNVSVRLTIPSDTEIDSTNNVEIRVRNQLDIKASAKHTTPGATLMVTEEVHAGGQMTISGANFEGFSSCRQ